MSYPTHFGTHPEGPVSGARWRTTADEDTAASTDGAALGEQRKRPGNLAGTRSLSPASSRFGVESGPRSRVPSVWPHGNFASRLFSRPVIPMAPRSRARGYQNTAVPAVALCAHTAHGVPRQAIPLPGRLRKGRGISAQPPSGSPPQEPKVCRLTAGGSWIRTSGPSYDPYPNGLQQALELCAHGQRAHP